MNRSPAQIFSSHLLAGLASGGVSSIFVSPGSRSQALAIAAWQLAEAGVVGLRVRIDERSAAFQALGVGKVTQTPAIAICTSGTAVANYHPAVLEAFHSGVPMLLLTADRPSELRGTGANQTTDQVGIYAGAVLRCIDVPAPADDESDEELAYRASFLVDQIWEAMAERPGPVQVNVCLREPLSATAPNAAELFAKLMAGAEDGEESSESGCGEDCACHQNEFADGATLVDLRLPTVVVAGDGGHLAQYYCTGVPVFAEPSSGARHLGESIPGYLAAMQASPHLVEQIEQVLVFGKPTLSRAIQALLKRPGMRVIVEPGNHDAVRPRPEAILLGNSVDLVGEPRMEWLEAWREAAAAVATLASSEPDEAVTRRSLIEAVYDSSDANTPLLLGASSLIREADRWAPAKELPVYSNRGLAGIDGTVATGIGLAMATAQNTEKAPQVRVLLGDVTVLHDAGSFSVDEHDHALNLQVIVGNDNGGSIFSGLEVAQSIAGEPFEKLFRTPQKVSLKALAEAYGWNYLLVSRNHDLTQALKTAGLVLIEVQLA